MVLETDPLPLSQWLAEALPTWLAVVGAVAFIWLLLGFLISTLKNGPGKAGDNLFKLLVAAASDLGSMSPRRVFALAQLAVKESWRKRVFAALGVYLVILAFAIWFLDPRSHDPAPLYLSFVLTATTYLILIMSLFLSAFSLPSDIKSHTIYTIVTKPVRSSEIVLGRILGFAFVGTVMLATMGLFSYLFVVRALDHTHGLSRDNLRVTKVPAETGAGLDGAPASEGEELSGFTEVEHGHRHQVVIGPDGFGRTDVVQGHWHEVIPSGSVSSWGWRWLDRIVAQSGYIIVLALVWIGAALIFIPLFFFLRYSWRNEQLRGQYISWSLMAIVLMAATATTIHLVSSFSEDANRRLIVGEPQGQFHARVPLYGALSFKDRAGLPTTKGINVGNEWTYRSYIDGGTRAAATWKFEGLDAADYPDGLPLNMTIRVFRSHKGDIEKTVLGSYVLRNPATGLTSEAANFNAKEYAIDEEVVPLRLKDSVGRPISLFEDLVSNGEVEVELVCLAPGQYFGMAQPDLYLLPREASFVSNLVKGYISIWLEMLLITAFGVMWSTFLNGPVAMLATFATLVMGFFVLFLRQIGKGEALGGGPAEASLRLLKQTALTVELDPSLTTRVLQSIDWVVAKLLLAASNLAPNFSEIAGTTYDNKAFNIPMGDASFVADGFDIPPELLLQQMIATAGFLVPIFLIGFLCLKMCEVAQ